MATRMAEDGFKDVGYKYVSIDVRFDNFCLNLSSFVAWFT